MQAAPDLRGFIQPATVERSEGRNRAIESASERSVQENASKKQGASATNNRTASVKNEQNLLNKDTKMNIFKKFFSTNDVDKAAEALKEEKRKLAIADAAAHQAQMRDNENTSVCGFGNRDTSQASINRYPPTLNGKLSNHKNSEPGSYDLFKTGHDKPIFRADLNQNSCQLLHKPTQQNVSELFKLADEMQIEKPLQVHGTIEFQRLALNESLKNGTECKFENATVQQDYQERIKIMQELERNRKLAEKLEKDKQHETEQLQRANELCATQDNNKEREENKGASKWKN
jgi:hypothetical protein